MKKNIHFITLVIALLLSFVGPNHAQPHRLASPRKKPVIINNADILIETFKNKIYQTIYQSDYWKKTTAPVFTTLKIDIDGSGKLTSLKFSDSADTLFVDEIFKKINIDTNKAILEKYAKEKAYQNISIIFPVSYRSNQSSNRGVDYSHAELLWVFGNKNFTGKFIMLPAIDVTLPADK